MQSYFKLCTDYSGEKGPLCFGNADTTNLINKWPMTTCRVLGKKHLTQKQILHLLLKALKPLSKRYPHLKLVHRPDFSEDYLGVRNGSFLTKFQFHPQNFLNLVL